MSNVLDEIRRRRMDSATAASQSATAEAPSPSPYSAPPCGHLSLWVDPYGKSHCRTCEPPPHPSVCRKRIDIAPIRPASREIASVGVPQCSSPRDRALEREFRDRPEPPDSANITFDVEAIDAYFASQREMDRYRRDPIANPAYQQRRGEKIPPIPRGVLVTWVVRRPDGSLVASNSEKKIQKGAEKVCVNWEGCDRWYYF